MDLYNQDGEYMDFKSERRSGGALVESSGVIATRNRTPASSPLFSSQHLVREPTNLDPNFNHDDARDQLWVTETLSEVFYELETFGMNSILGKDEDLPTIRIFQELHG